MSRYNFSPAERYGVWVAFHGQCYWCGRPLELQETTVDHVLPESLEEKPDDLKRLLNYLGLKEFGLNTFRNWVPAHDRCNSRKKDLLLPEAPVTAVTLECIAKRAVIAAETCKKVVDNQKRDKLLGKIMVAVEKGTVTREDIVALFEDVRVPPPVVGTDDLDLLVAPGWALSRREGNLAILEREGRVGMTWGKPNPHHSWICAHCGNAGPWNGVICLSCGQKSDPD